MIPCNPEAVLGKIPLVSKSKPNRISSQKINHKNNTKKSGRPITELVNLKCLSIVLAFGSWLLHLFTSSI
jgi:hypothetical protein